jgi:hypothetical protein
VFPYLKQYISKNIPSHISIYLFEGQFHHACGVLCHVF